jgi:hypothetical protein
MVGYEMEINGMQQHLTDPILFPAGAGTTSLPRSLEERMAPGLVMTLVVRVWRHLASQSWQAESEARLSRYTGGRV